MSLKVAGAVFPTLQSLVKSSPPARPGRLDRPGDIMATSVRWTPGCLLRWRYGKPSASGRSECEEETLTFWIRTRLWLSPAHQKQPALESAPVVLVWFNYRRGLCLIGVYVGHYTQQTQCVFTSSAGYIRRFGWWWKKFHLRITDVFFLPLSFVWSLPPSPSFSLSLSPSLVVFSRVARSFLDSLMENHHHTEAKFLLSLSQSD